MVRYFDQSNVIFRNQQVVSMNKPIALRNNQILSDLIKITVLLGIFYALWIGSHPLFTPDEGRYSEVAREMVVTGDYVTPRLNGVVFLDKPILYYWLQASAIKLFGIKEWALRFWPALIGILGCLVTYVGGFFLFNRRTGLISALILATSPLYYGAAHYANLDLEVAVFVSSSLIFFLLGLQNTTSKRKGFLVAAYVFAGLAALTKGLIGLAFPALVVGSWMLIRRHWSILKKLNLLMGFIIFLCITAPWYVLVQKANPEFFEFFFVKQQVSRFLTTEHFNNRTTWWFYFPIVLAGIFPWCVFTIQALAYSLKEIKNKLQENSTQLFLILWLTLIFTFFSIPKSKTVGYILPIFPALALILGNYLNARWELFTKGILSGLYAFSILSIGIVSACILVSYLPNGETNQLLIPYLKMTAILFTLSGVISLFLLKQKQLKLFFNLLLITAMSFLLIISASSNAINQKTIKPLTHHLKPILKPSDEVITYNKYYQDLPIYLERRITIVNDWNTPDIALSDNWKRELWYGMPFQNTKEWLINEEMFWKRWNSNKRIFVFTGPHFYKQIKQQSKTTVFKIAEYNDVVLLSNKL